RHVAAGRIVARVLRRDDRIGGATELSPVRRVEVRAVALAGVQRAVRPEEERARGVARELLAPVLDQDLLAGADRVAVHGEPRAAAAGDAAVGRRAGRSRPRVAPARGGVRAAEAA